MFNLRWSDSPPGRCIFSGFSRLEGKDQRHVEEQSESSPVLESSVLPPRRPPSFAPLSGEERLRSELAAFDQSKARGADWLLLCSKTNLIAKSFRQPF